MDWSATEKVDQHTQGRALGFLGGPRVNVLDVNRAPDTVARG